MKKVRIKYKNILLMLLILIFSILIIICGYKIFCWYKDNRNTNKQIENINKIVKIEEVEEPKENEGNEEDKTNSNIEIVNPPEDKLNPYWDYIKTKLIDVDFNELKKVNSETKGWLQVNGTNINYPFVQTKDNDYYLTHSFDKSYNEAGWIYMDYRNNPKFQDKNTILYGHGRLNNTMFGNLKNIINSSWFKNSSNYVLKISTETENTLWQVFSVYKIPTTSDYLKVKFSSDSQYTKFLNKLSSRSVHNFNVSLTEKDKIVTLSTCYNDKEKVVMHAKLIKSEKK